MIARTALAAFLLAVGVAASAQPNGPAQGLGELWRLPPGQTKMVNGLWGENAPERQFGNGRSRVVIADLKGPGIITMIHFALPQTLKMDRDTVLRIWWDGERNPSVEAPLVDFFCDPNGALERVDSAFANKKRGWNCYFAMPFRKSARIEVSCDNPRYPNGLWAANPCYSYVMYRAVKALPADAVYFHASWRQRAVKLLQEEYEALRATGRGEFIGWNVSVRGVDPPGSGYFVDENEKFWVDGEASPSIEWQGLEDSFGFSWGFPEQANGFPLTGYQPYYGSGAAAYRFLPNDRISFRKSLRVTIGFGKEEQKAWRAQFPNTPLHEFSSVCYWYQTEPHLAFPALPSARKRQPSALPQAASVPVDAGDTLELRCGHPDGDLQYAADGWDFAFLKGYAFNGHPWTSDIKHCWADFKTLAFDVVCPPRATGWLRLYLLDGDNFAGGRRETISLSGRQVGVYEDFQAGRWVDIRVTPADTANGRLHVTITNTRPGGNAVATYVRFRPAGVPGGNR